MDKIRMLNQQNLRVINHSFHLNSTRFQGYPALTRNKHALTHLPEKYSEGALILYHDRKTNTENKTLGRVSGPFGCGGNRGFILFFVCRIKHEFCFPLPIYAWF